ncbi:FAD-dependent oxidoreductase [Rufibacter sediminis]|uniref:FAD-dependent oxidoreductase n=1 Tax=Rufibacter sediminis TaxID=2762756 RepID=A0ABR6VMT1_9BACT|nr:NAD(P)/FAD-dependent oxidoreductase [Rufibacter sediminis]MBC3538222.1 FAD-dependent oxidoreductase [Rufibacter sediminis]
MKAEERRRFLKQSALALGGLALAGTALPGCGTEETKQVAGRLFGPSFKAGHLLRTGIRKVPARTQEVDVVIIGGGVSGLSAARWLQKNSEQRVCLLELEDRTGGNSQSGKNAHSAFPWGAHYLPLPNNSNTQLLRFLEEAKLITGYDAAGLPLYNEYHLCFDPEERLFINGYWQEGLVPNWSVPPADLQQIDRFQALMDEMKQAKGADGRFAFDIPLAHSSSDDQFRQLDQLTMQDWLQKQNLTSTYLSWYVEYCCLDDFGGTLAQTSAWAAIHYFAARRAQAANSDAHRVLTWPQGNHWLAERLREQAGPDLRTGSLVYNLEVADDKIVVDYLDLATDEATRLMAKKCVMATPQFVRERLLAKVPAAPKVNSRIFTYAPWVVANLTLNQVPAGKGIPLSWDNVIYGSSSLGYVNAQHQSVVGFPDKQVITFYYPIPDTSPASRQAVFTRKREDWTELVLQELEKAHPSIREEVEQLDVWVWGHGMIKPTPGFIWGPDREAAAQPIQNKIAFAHSDLSGISIFEEAFYKGIKAAQQILTS